MIHKGSLIIFESANTWCLVMEIEASSKSISITYSTEGRAACSSHASGFSPGALPQAKNVSCSRQVTCPGWICLTLDRWNDE